MTRRTPRADTLSIYLSLLAGLILVAAAAGAALLETEEGKQLPDARPAATKADKSQKEAAPVTERALAAIQLPPPPAPRASPAVKPVSRQMPASKPVATIKPMERSQIIVSKTKSPKIQPLKPVSDIKPAVVDRNEKPLELEPNPPSPSKPAPAPQPNVDARKTQTEGRSLLRLLEHGTGPAIEIAWPQSSLDRYKLYQRLIQCEGMKLAVIGSDKQIFQLDGTAGQSWNFNGDKFSGFLRSPEGMAVAAETATFSAIAVRHRLTDWQPVRVFPRRVDAILLGGLKQLIGDQYRTARTIHAAYKLANGTLSLSAVTVDGSPVEGSITLSTTCRGPRVS